MIRMIHSRGFSFILLLQPEASLPYKAFLASTCDRVYLILLAYPLMLSPLWKVGFTWGLSCNLLAFPELSGSWFPVSRAGWAHQDTRPQPTGKHRLWGCIDPEFKFSLCSLSPGVSDPFIFWHIFERLDVFLLYCFKSSISKFCVLEWILLITSSNMVIETY